MKVGLRLAKLEAMLPAATALTRTREEERILIYEVFNALVRSGKFPHLNKRLASFVNQIAAEIRRKAAHPRTEVYRQYISYIEEMWVASGRSHPFVPPVLGSDYDEWFHPGLAERRLAVRRRPSVIALLGEMGSSPSWWQGIARNSGVLAPDLGSAQC